MVTGLFGPYGKGGIGGVEDRLIRRETIPLDSSTLMMTGWVVLVRRAVRPALSVSAVSAGVAASPQGRVRPGPGRSDRGGGGPAEQVPGHRKTWHWDSGKTSLRRVRKCGLPGGRWSAHALWRVGPASYRSSQCVRTGRTCEDAATSLRRLGIQRNRSRWEESKRRFQVWRSFRLLLGFTCRRPLTTLRWRVSGAEGKGHRRQRSGSTSSPARSQCPVSAAAS
jgi:hypothetical protein